MRTIHKHRPTNPWESRFRIQVQVGARILYVNHQDHVPTLWMEVETKNEYEEREFAVIGTGHLIPEDAREYVGTYFDHPYVWHMYELENDKNLEGDL